MSDAEKLLTIINYIRRIKDLAQIIGDQTSGDVHNQAAMLGIMAQKAGDNLLSLEFPDTTTTPDEDPFMCGYCQALDDLSAFFEDYKSHRGHV